VGYGQNSAGAEVNEALRFDGRKWRNVSTPQPGGTSASDFAYLEGLACPSASDCWAAGGYNSAGAYLNEALQWNGKRWMQATIPNPGGSTSGADNELTALFCTSASDCWTAGYYYNNSGTALNQVLHYDGHTWTPYATPQPGGTTNSAQGNTLNAIACMTPTECWALGGFTTGTGHLQNEALRWNSRQWSDSSSLFIPSLDGRLTGAGVSFCGSLPGSSTSIVHLSCQAAQRTVQSGPYPGVWSMSQVISATLHAGPGASPSARRQYASDLYATFTQYTDGLSFSTGLTPTPVIGNLFAQRFYDDNAWAGMDLLAAYQQVHQRRLLAAAQGVVTFERTGQWRTSDPPNEQRFPGGIYWNTHRRTRPILPNAGAAQVALELALLTHNGSDLAFGEQEYRWIRATLGTASGLYRARVEPGGTITGTSNDNGDGLMIGDGVFLYRITGNRQYLKEAMKTATASLKRFTPSVMEATCPAQDAIYLYNLKALDAVSPLPAFKPLLNTYADWAANQSDSKTGAFSGLYGRACEPPLPQAGVTGTLILRATS
jgi:hypothetical protein